MEASAFFHFSFYSKVADMFTSFMCLGSSCVSV